MTIKDEIKARLQGLKDDKAAELLAMQTKYDAEIAELQSFLDINEPWLNKDADAFRDQVNHVIAVVRIK